MISLKGCPKCHGDLYLRLDEYGMFRSCLQCGYLVDIAEAGTKQVARKRLSRESRKALVSPPGLKRAEEQKGEKITA